MTLMSPGVIYFSREYWCKRCGKKYPATPEFNRCPDCHNLTRKKAREKGKGKEKKKI